MSSLLLLPQAQSPIIGVAWTLTYELGFYLIFAAVIGFGRFAATLLAPSWLTFIVLSNLGLVSTDYPAMGVLGDERNVEFMLGVVGALGVLIRRRPFPWAWVAIGAVLYTAVAALHVDAGQQITKLHGMVWRSVSIDGGWRRIVGDSQTPDPLAIVGGVRRQCLILHLPHPYHVHYLFDRPDYIFMPGSVH